MQNNTDTLKQPQILWNCFLTLCWILVSI